MKLVFAFSIIKSEPFKYKDYVYPWYAEMLGNLSDHLDKQLSINLKSMDFFKGWIIAFSSVGLIPIYGIYKIFTNCGNLKEVKLI